MQFPDDPAPRRLHQLLPADIPGSLPQDVAEALSDRCKPNGQSSDLFCLTRIKSRKKLPHAEPEGQSAIAKRTKASLGSGWNQAGLGS